MLYDTHCHPNLAKLKDKHEIIKNFHTLNHDGFLNIIGTNIDTSMKVIKIAKEYDFVFASVGIHPTDTIEYVSQKKQDIEAVIDVLQDLYLENTKKVVAIGECGLDYYWIPKLMEKYHLSEEEIKKIQREFFIAHIELAKKYNLPFIIHNRESRDDVFAILQETNAQNFIFHCYSEDLEYAQKLIAFAPNCKISFSGIVTFDNAKALQETAKNIPLKNILVETDSPYLTPAPYRGKEENEPAFTQHVLNKIIALRHEGKDAITKQIFQNSIQTFGIQ